MDHGLAVLHISQLNVELEKIRNPCGKLDCYLWGGLLPWKSYHPVPLTAPSTLWMAHGFFSTLVALRFRRDILPTDAWLLVASSITMIHNPWNIPLGRKPYKMDGRWSIYGFVQVKLTVATSLYVLKKNGLFQLQRGSLFRNAFDVHTDQVRDDFRSYPFLARDFAYLLQTMILYLQQATGYLFPIW